MTSDPGTNTIGYRLLMGFACGVYAEPPTNLGNTTSVIVSKLKSGTKYFFAITVTTQRASIARIQMKSLTPFRSNRSVLRRNLLCNLCQKIVLVFPMNIRSVSFHDREGLRAVPFFLGVMGAK